MIGRVAALCALVLMGFAMVDDAAAADNAKVTMTTSKGVIVLELDAGKAPKTVANFIAYARAGHYDGTIFHRVIKGFMIQGGGFMPGMNQKSTNDPIRNEADNGLRNDTGTIAMARTGDPHSASAQFFINTADNAFLNHSAKNDRGWGYAVFGRVVEGLDVVRKIEAVGTGRAGPYSDVPVDDVVIQTVTVQ